MITGANERDLQANDKFDAARSPFRKLVFFFHTDEEAVDFAGKYNAYSGLTGLDESELEVTCAAEPHLDELVAYVVIDNIRACDIQDTLDGIEKISPMANLPGFSMYVDAAKQDRITFEDIVGELECSSDVDVIPEIVDPFDEDPDADNVIPVPLG